LNGYTSGASACRLCAEVTFKEFVMKKFIIVVLALVVVGLAATASYWAYREMQTSLEGAKQFALDRLHESQLRLEAATKKHAASEIARAKAEFGRYRDLSLAAALLRRHLMERRLTLQLPDGQTRHGVYDRERLCTPDGVYALEIRPATPTGEWSLVVVIDDGEEYAVEVFGNGDLFAFDVPGQGWGYLYLDDDPVSRRN